MKDIFNENIHIHSKEIKEIGSRESQKYEYLEESEDAMGLTFDQRRELMDRIMEKAWNEAKEAVPYSGNIFDDTDEADAVIEKRMQIVVQKMLELKKQYRFPIARYDREIKPAYIEYADGHREYFD